MQVEIPILGDLVHVQIHGAKDAKKCIFILPPGGLNFEYSTIVSLLNSHMTTLDLSGYEIVIFEYPGIGTAPAYRKVSVNIVAQKCISFLKMKQYDEVTLIGFSFGGSVALDMLDEVPRLFSKVIIVASGEYFEIIPRTVLFLFFYISLISKKLNMFIYFFLVHVLKIFSPFVLNDLDNLIQMGRSIVRYRIHATTHQLPALLVFCKNDAVVRKSSVPKLVKKFPYGESKEIAVRHTKLLTTTEIKTIKTLITESIVPFLSSTSQNA